jgi:hypothetical protein
MVAGISPDDCAAVMNAEISWAVVCVISRSS